MEIKDVENLLSVSRSNIRFYEKEGLINPERNENNYRNYSDSDIAMLKKIIVLRKLGFSVEEISDMQKGSLLLSDVVETNIVRLESEIERLKGALETSKKISSEHLDFRNLDQEYYWNEITLAENEGKEFVNIYKDYLSFELSMLDNMWKYVFFHDFKKSRKKYGPLIASGILLLLCLLRGIGAVFIRHESFWDGFLYPIFLFILGSLIMLPLYILSKKAPNIAGCLSTVILVLCVGFLAFCILYIIVMGIVSLFT